MKKRAIFHPEAEAEFLASVAYYADRAGDLGERFYQEIRRLVAEIEASPRRHGPWRHGTRRHRAKRFPYAVIFAERSDRLCSSRSRTANATPITGAGGWFELRSSVFRHHNANLVQPAVRASIGLKLSRSRTRSKAAYLVTLDAPAGVACWR